MSSETDAIWAEFDAATRDGGTSATQHDTSVHAPPPRTDDRQSLLHQSSEAVTQRRVTEERERTNSAQAIGRVNDAICAQLHATWCSNGRTRLADTDFVTGSANPREKCSGCKADLFRLTLYLVQATEHEDATLVDGFKRLKMSSEMFLRDEAYADAEMSGVIGAAQRRTAADLAERRAKKAASPRSQIDLGVYNCLLHACVEEFCMLPFTAPKRLRDLYNRVHARPLTSAPLAADVYFCARHTRFHVCDEFCDQTEPGRYSERVCVLSSRVKRDAEHDFSLPDGATAGAREHSDAMHDSELMLADYDNDASGFMSGDNNTGSRPAARRRAAYSEVSIIRDRGDASRNRLSGAAMGVRGGRRRGRGRGRGSIAAGSAERSRIDRIRLAESMIRSSGDDDAALVSPLQAAAQFERIAAGDMARRTGSSLSSAARGDDIDDVVIMGESSGGSKRSTSKRRKLGRAKRVKSRLANQGAQMTLTVPRAFLDGDHGAEIKIEEEESDEEEEEEEVEPMIDERIERLEDIKPRLTGVKSERDVMMNGRLAMPVGGESACRNIGRGGTVAVSFDVRAKIPFAERPQGKYDEEFALDVLIEQRDRAERLERFQLDGNATTNTFFSTTQLFEQYGERACAIIWRLMCSRERDAIEKQKTISCANRTRSDIDAYVNTQRKRDAVAVAERIERVCRTVYDKAGLFKRIVVDEALWKVVETYTALLVVEFYFNLVSLPPRISIHLTQETADTIKNQFFFENFVVAILPFMCEGLDVNGVVILPRDMLLVREWWPQTATLRTLGVADQTMTHLVSTIRAYIEAARSSNVSMRRFEATTIEFEELVALRLPGVVPGSETMSSRELARAAARRVVELFIQRRARRLEALMHN